jgi:hypothetical protein
MRGLLVSFWRVADQARFPIGVERVPDSVPPVVARPEN